MEGLPFPKNILNIILNNILNTFPEYLKRLLRLVCKYWRDFIKVNYKVEIIYDEMIVDIIKHDYGNVLRWFWKHKISKKFRFGRRKHLVFEYGSVKCLKALISNNIYYNELSIETLDLLKDRETDINILNIYYSDLCILENRFNLFFCCYRHKKYIVPWIFENDFISKSLIEKVIKKEKHHHIIEDYFIHSNAFDLIEIMSQYFTVNLDFLQMVVHKIKKYGFFGRSEIISDIMLLTGVSYGSDVCGFIKDKEHEKVKHLCGCKIEKN